MTHIFTRPLAAVALCAATLTLTAAHAQAPAAPVEAIPAPTCDQPLYPGRAAREKEMEKFNAKLAVYQKCMNEYIESQKKAAETSLEDQKKHVDELNGLSARQTELKNKITLSIDKQKRHVEARNLAVNEYNALMTKLKKEAGQ
ncbi:MAG: hypothetical protein JNM76_09825 [Betaproteobacteria bacterium]|nr:hypothetical protein [Betaproteobacteria bacterium]